jgi:uracil-DNA glycosylase family 4
MPNWDLMREWNVPPENFLILNSLQCLPPRKKDDARRNTEAIKQGAFACRPRLIDQIQEHPRKLIVACGNHALWSLTGSYSLKITQVRGQLIPSPLSELGILPVLHPAALLRGTGNYRQFRMDLEYAIDLLRGFPKKQPVQTFYYVCHTKERVLATLRRLMKKPLLYCDTETTGFNRFDDNTLCLGIAHDPRLVYIFVGEVSPEKALEIGAHPDWPRSGSTIPMLREFFRKYPGKLVWHNGKFDVSFTRREGCSSRVDEDTMLLSYAYDEQGGIHDLEQVSGDLLGSPDYKHVIKQYAPRKADSYAKVPPDVLFNYLALDVGNTAGIFPILRRRISEDPALEKLYTRLLLPASEFLWHVEHHGIMVSRFAVERQQRRLQKEIDRAYHQIQEVAKQYGYQGEVNPGSPQQMASLIFDHLKLKPPAGTNRSTAKGVLDQLPQHPVIKALKLHRGAQKNKGTYADAILRNIQQDGRVHSTFMLHGTRTGRLAHKVVANIPRDKRIRGMYVAPKGHVFIKADVDQAELRSLAALSNDPELCAIYRSNVRKLHREVADGIFKRKDWNNEQYMRAKALNFGIVYGRQAESIAEEFRISTTEAQGYINWWTNNFPVAWDFILKCRNSVLKGQTLVTPFGAKKRHWLVTQANVITLQNEASNFPHQNLASNITLAAAIKVAPVLEEEDVHIVNLVHDELLAECPDQLDKIEWARNLITQAIEEVPKEWGITRVPFKSDTEIGRRWGIYRHVDKNDQWSNYLRSKIRVVESGEEKVA